MTDFFENLLSNGELQEKVAELQGKIDAYQMSENEANEIIVELKAENERLKENDCEQCKHLDLYIKYKQTLQKIKTIAEAPKPFIDFSEIKTATEVEYDYAAICNELELRLHKVLELITKAGEE
jgi:hypothetical protein